MTNSEAVARLAAALAHDDVYVDFDSRRHPPFCFLPPRRKKRREKLIAARPRILPKPVPQPVPNAVPKPVPYALGDAALARSILSQRRDEIMRTREIDSLQAEIKGAREELRKVRWELKQALDARWQEFVDTHWNEFVRSLEGT